MQPIVTELVNSPEFYNRHVATCATGPVDGIYIRLLGRNADQGIVFLSFKENFSFAYNLLYNNLLVKILIEFFKGGKAYWTSQLILGWQFVANGIMKTVEFQNKMQAMLAPTAPMACNCASG